MLRIRIVATGALFSALLLAAGLTAGRAVAQTASSPAAGSPLQLLKTAEQPNDAPNAKHHARSVAKSMVAARKEPRHRHRLRIAAKRRHAAPQVAETAPPPPAASAPADARGSASVWPAVNTAQPIGVATVQPAPAPASTPTDPPPGELVGGGQKVKVASPGEVNDIDLAAGDKAAQASDAAPAVAAPAIAETAAVAQKSDSMKATPAPQGSPIGSTSWLLQVLAALGGAVTAGSVAWFLIGGAPQRTYG